MTELERRTYYDSMISCGYRAHISSNLISIPYARSSDVPRRPANTSSRRAHLVSERRNRHPHKDVLSAVQSLALGRSPFPEKQLNRMNADKRRGDQPPSATGRKNEPNSRPNAACLQAVVGTAFSIRAVDNRDGSFECTMT